MIQIGDRATFAAEVGARTSRDLRTVDLWAAGKLLTTDDNAAFVPSFCHFLRSTAAQVRGGEVPACPYPERTPEQIFRLLHADDKTDLRQKFWLLHWGETVDNVSSYTYLDKDENVVIVFAFWRKTHPHPDDLGKIFTASIPPAEFATTLEKTADLLEADT
jgi:hypothetical protein